MLWFHIFACCLLISYMVGIIPPVKCYQLISYNQVLNK
nr:MAG TPA: hypothetical protein [Caudoviricetes sp.]